MKYVLLLVHILDCVFGIQNGKFGKLSIWCGEFEGRKIMHFCLDVVGDQIGVMGKAEGQWVSRFLPE